MAEEQKFRTARYIDNAERTYGRLRGTTLRKTGLEDVLQRAAERNFAVLESNMKSDEFMRFKDSAPTPDAVWKEVKRRNLGGDARAKEIITMSLGNPSAYSGFPPNSILYECLSEISSNPDKIRESSSYTTSFGYPPLLRKLKGANFCDPASVFHDPSKFKDVKVYVTTGSTNAVEAAMSPTLLTPSDTLLVHDWTYIIHLASAYMRNAHVDSYECRNDGRPDAASLRRILLDRQSSDRTVQTIVFTPIGNPVGAAMTREEIIEHMKIIEEAIRKENRPILTMIDIAYEPFRRDGKPLDPIEMAMDEGIRAPIAVLDTTSKGYGTCGWRMGKLAIHWPEDEFPDTREDYFTSLENKALPTLGVVGVPMQMAFNMFFEKLTSDPALMERTKGYFRARRHLINENLLHMATELRSTTGVYLSKYYDNGGRNGGLEPDTLSSFYLLFGFTKLSERYGSGFNQALAFAEYALQTPGVPISNAVPGQSFLPSKRVSEHPALIRVTGLTDKEETDAFIESVRMYARHLG
jgi:aspartate/methionine/tyrosine aminotransferase